MGRVVVVSESSHDLSVPWVQRFTETTWTVIDVSFALLLAAGTLTHLYVFPSSIPRSVLIPLDLAATLPIAVRRRYPGTSLSIVVVALAISTATGRSLAPVPVIALPLYSFTVVTNRRRSLYTLVGVESSLLVGLAVAALADRAHGDVTFNLILAAATWVVGDAVRTRRGYLEEQERQRHDQAVDNATRAIVEERLAIARELHDVLAHSLAVIAIQSGVGRHLLDTQPGQAREALEVIEYTSRDALDELRHVLGALRSADHDTVPTPGLAELHELVRSVISTGTSVELVTRGAEELVAPGLQLSLYRIAQEALTNVVKHAPGARARVELVVGHDEIRLDVTNTPSAQTRPNGPPGHGLLGMSERASLFGGTLRAEPQSHGGFAVTAVFPRERER